MSTFLLIVLILVLAAVGGFLGTLLEVAGWLLLIFIVLGAIIGGVIWRALSNLGVGSGSGRP